jgi:hypothetical protein
VWVGKNNGFANLSEAQLAYRSVARAVESYSGPLEANFEKRAFRPGKGSPEKSVSSLANLPRLWSVEATLQVSAKANAFPTC